MREKRAKKRIRKSTIGNLKSGDYAADPGL
jgi:hypothetical protein